MKCAFLKWILVAFCSILFKIVNYCLGYCPLFIFGAIEPVAMQMLLLVKNLLWIDDSDQSSKWKVAIIVELLDFHYVPSTSGLVEEFLHFFFKSCTYSFLLSLKNIYLILWLNQFAIRNISIKLIDNAFTMIRID